MKQIVSSRRYKIQVIKVGGRVSFSDFEQWRRCCLDLYFAGGSLEGESWHLYDIGLYSQSRGRVRHTSCVSMGGLGPNHVSETHTLSRTWVRTTPPKEIFFFLFAISGFYTPPPPLVSPKIVTSFIGKKEKNSLEKTRLRWLWKRRLIITWAPSHHRPRRPIRRKRQWRTSLYTGDTKPKSCSPAGRVPTPACTHWRWFSCSFWRCSWNGLIPATSWSKRPRMCGWWYCRRRYTQYVRV